MRLQAHNRDQSGTLAVNFASRLQSKKKKKKKAFNNKSQNALNLRLTNNDKDDDNDDDNGDDNEYKYNKWIIDSNTDLLDLLLYSVVKVNNRL